MHLNVRLCGMPPSALYFLGFLEKSSVVFTDAWMCVCVWAAAEGFYSVEVNFWLLCFKAGTLRVKVHVFEWAVCVHRTAAEMFFWRVKLEKTCVLKCTCKVTISYTNANEGKWETGKRATLVKTVLTTITGRRKATPLRMSFRSRSIFNASQR